MKPKQAQDQAQTVRIDPRFEEMGLSIMQALAALKWTDTLKIKRLDLGVEIRAFYNNQHIVGISIYRVDKHHFFEDLEVTLS